MTVHSDMLGHDLKAWAAEQLQVELPCTAVKLRTAYWRRMRHENGSPNLTAREAMLILMGNSNPVRPALALEAVEDRLERDVDNFASRFFSLEPGERQTEWEKLKDRGQGFVRVDTRLAALRPGLTVVLPHFQCDSSIGKLAALVCELFVLRALDRAARRQASIDSAIDCGEWCDWAAGAALLREKHPSIAKLEPELIGILADAEVRADEKDKAAATMRTIRMGRAEQLIQATKDRIPWRRTKIALLLTWIFVLKVWMVFLRMIIAILPAAPDADGAQKDGEDKRKSANNSNDTQAHS